MVVFRREKPSATSRLTFYLWSPRGSCWGRLSLIPQNRDLLFFVRSLAVYRSVHDAFAARLQDPLNFKRLYEAGAIVDTVVTFLTDEVMDENSSMPPKKAKERKDSLTDFVYGVKLIFSSFMSALVSVYISRA